MPLVKDLPLRRFRPSEDVIPFSECRNTLSECLARTQRTHRPLLVTQNGRASAYLVGAEDFDSVVDQMETWRERMELTTAVRISRKQFETGDVVSHDDLMKRLRDKITRGGRA